MVSGCCSGDDLLIIEGPGILVTGSGTPANPFVVSSVSPDVAGSLIVRDTATVNMTMLGAGNALDPFIIRATAVLKVNDLSDVEDPSGGPVAGESLIYTGTGPTAHWEYGTLPPAPAGAVNVSVGLSGVGDVGDPIKVDVSGVWGTGALAGLGGDSTIGLPVYEDSAGQLRAKPVTSATVDWATGISGKPTTFTPSAHSHVAGDISNPLSLDVGKINGRKISATATSSTPPASPTALDLWFFPKGA